MPERDVDRPKAVMIFTSTIASPRFGPEDGIVKSGDHWEGTITTGTLSCDRRSVKLDTGLV